MKRLIVCCDGTWNRSDQNRNGEPCPTNVIRLAYRIASWDGSTAQILYYDEGVGTGNKMDHWLGGAFGTGLESNLFEAYRFLVANYTPGDEIFLFGFSRGAFTARSLAGLIRNSGILSRRWVDKYPEAVGHYRDRDRDSHPDAGQMAAFRKEHAVEPVTPIKLVGVWDTVGARGIPIRAFNKKYEFHDLQISGSIEHAYHALALDEHRKPYDATLWQNPPKKLYAYPGDGVEQEETRQTIEQVWFAGAHSDVGGGYGGRSTPNLSDIPLKWMMEKAEAAGLRFDEEVTQQFPLRGYDAYTGAELHDPYTWKFKPLGRIARTVGRSTTEYLHRTALDRMERSDLDPRYRSEPLESHPQLERWKSRDPRPPQLEVRPAEE